MHKEEKNNSLELNHSLTLPAKKWAAGASNGKLPGPN